MQKSAEQVTRARTLRADILAAPDVWLPRRDVLLDWLNLFILRAGSSRQEADVMENEDLDALDRFLRKQKIPVS